MMKKKKLRKKVDSLTLDYRLAMTYLDIITSPETSDRVRVEAFRDARSLVLLKGFGTNEFKGLGEPDFDGEGEPSLLAQDES